MEEYSIQYFGFTPKSFCNGVYNAMNEYLSECIKAVMDFMTIEYADLLSADQIETGISKILAQYSEVFDQNFDRFELYFYLFNLLPIFSNFYLYVLSSLSLPFASLLLFLKLISLSLLHLCLVCFLFFSFSLSTKHFPFCLLYSLLLISIFLPFLLIVAIFLIISSSSSLLLS
ncbi:unnamed protein product [Acanthosepion pharaonis]|uniref:Protein MIS12 homolog n=1 Tax=Acanthosepion pharaonis TaxID=158019 RepID=A0A812C090_ACAPH|nr:unnamed protein product [Sepia pharaonis]